MRSVGSFYRDSQQHLVSCEPLVLGASSKFHRAAIDGYVDMLCEASKRETNAPASNKCQLTPTLLAAQSGQLEALRILVGRGGDPERVSSSGSSALHLAASRGHLSCVSFLVNFGVNMWALDNDLRTAKEVAAMEQHKLVLDYLDQLMARHSAINTKQVQKAKERAKRAAERRLKEARKVQLKAIKQVERDERQLAKLSHQRRLLRAAHSISDIKLVGRAGVEVASGLQPKAFSGQLVAHSANLQHGAPAKQHQVRGATRNSSDQESHSSVSSTSGYLSSSCSTRSMLKSAQLGQRAEDALGQWSRKRPCGAEQSQLSSGSRPKYSDLVALKGAAAAAASRSSTEANEKPDDKSSSQSTFALRLRAIGGVSRKVHLRKLLNVGQNSGKKSNQLPEVGTSLKRARSEPDLATVELSECLDESSESESKLDDELELGEANAAVGGQPKEEEKQRGSSIGENQQHVVAPRKTNSSAADPKDLARCPPAPPPPPPPPPQLPSMAPGAGLESDSSIVEQAKRQQQQHLLTQCLSQLKLQHEAVGAHRAALGCKQVGKSMHLGDTDELLRHQLSAGEFPLRPSLIKHQQQRSSAGALAQACCDISTTTTTTNKQRLADSIGSASSFVQSICSSSTCSSELGSATEQQLGRVAATSGAPPLNVDDFLLAHGLGDLRPTLARERIDFEALLLLSEDDLKSLNILLGPRRKLLNAIERHKGHSLGPGQSGPAFLVVDTQF